EYQLDKIVGFSKSITPSKYDLNTHKPFNIPLSSIRADLLFELYELNIKHDEIINIIFKSNFSHTDFRYLRIAKKNLSHLKLHHSDFSNTVIEFVDFTGASLSETKFAHSWMTGN